MLVPLSNTPRDYAWGSTTLLAELEGRAPSGQPEAEVWFGDHPDDPAVTADGRPLDQWLADEGPAAHAPARLPYLLKLLAAGSNLSIQVHPSKSQAEVGYASEEHAGVARDAAERTYRDDNHKPELIVALGDGFRALAGLRPLERTHALLASIGDAAAGLAGRLDGSEHATTEAIAWLLSDAASDDVRAIIAAARATHSDSFAAELALVGTLDDGYPGDPGIIVALLMNLVTLRRGEGLFVPAGVLHAYIEGLGVELMAASDNVVRGGLTPKHIDVPALVALLDARAAEVPIVRPTEVDAGVARYDVPVADFALLAVHPDPDEPVTVPLQGVAIVLATAGELGVEVAGSGQRMALAPGEAALVTPDEGELTVSGVGQLFVATPGR